MKSNGKSKHILIAALASLIAVSTAAASVMTGCGNDSNSKETGSTVTITETQVVSSVVEYTYATDENNQDVTENQNSDNKSDNSSANSNNSNSNNSNNNTSNKTNSEKSENSNSSDKSESQNNKSDNNKTDSDKSDNSDDSDKSENSADKNNNNSSSSSKVLTIDGKRFSVGDTITCVYQLKTPENLENYQATIEYNSDFVKVKSAELNSPASAGGILNYNLDGMIKFNGSSVSLGYNYTKARDFITVVYEVKKEGSTSTNLVWEVATGKSGKAYVKDNKPVNGLKTTKSYK